VPALGEDRQTDPAMTEHGLGESLPGCGAQSSGQMGGGTAMSHVLHREERL